MPNAAPDPSARCPCGHGGNYGECCGRFHAHSAVAATAEALMRSRYTAYAVGDSKYLLDTWHPTTRPASLPLDPDVHWRHLRVIDATGGLYDTAGVVEFEATYRLAGRTGRVHERSRFVREGGAWLYVDGESG